MKTHIQALLAPCMSVAAALLLAACGPSTLEFRNAEIVQGKFYRQGADKPFSGKIDNVPSHTILIRKEFDTISTLPTNVLDKAAPGVQHNALGQVCEVRVDEGVLDGATTCTTGAGKFKAYEMTFDQGVLTGEFKFYFPGTNKPEAVVRTDHGVLDGRSVVYGPESGREVYNATFKQGKLARTEEIFDDQTGKLVRRTPVEDGAITGEIVEYTKHGAQLSYRANVQMGLKHGVEEKFIEESGILEYRQNWVMGKLDGEVVRSKRDPKTERTVNEQYVAARYENGKLVYEANAREQYIPDQEQIAEDARQEKIRACVKERRDKLTQEGRGFYADSAIGQLTAECYHAVVAATSNTSGTALSSGTEPTPAKLRSCVDTRIVAFRVQHGEDEVITADQLGEWEAECRSGKRPG
ncbi:antitoxin component YwqK of YwqJK toxin-antitoxin module [Variovorax paradoxus]|uniref:toxin-antitoxin system YwqK family antitoxin n=1 Tax=Variovorax gossypii TaxID=1679495 RepID=UPI00119A0D87|nr:MULTISPECIES: hypothetical protein [Variovorax]MDR6522175.1 antitoxin component YwqK of YwqJK toxin-antitoxin module [Variovorax paradoxus]